MPFERRDLIGVLVLSVVETSPCLQVCIYQEPDGQLDYRAQKLRNYDLRRAVRDQMRCWQPAVRTLWVNDHGTRYYLQLHARWSPGIVLGNGTWEPRDLEAIKE